MEIKENNFKIFKFRLEKINLISYMIVINNEAILIDPTREIYKYKEKLEELNVKLKYIIMTNFQNEYCKGHLLLSKEFNVPIHSGVNYHNVYETINILNMKELNFNNIQLKFIETPGNTLESISILLKEYDLTTKNYIEKYIFTGVIWCEKIIGSPDNLNKNNESINYLTVKLFDTINKIINFNDNIKVLPNYSDSPINKICSLNEIKKNNYYLNLKDKEEFQKSICDKIPHPLNQKELIFYKDNQIHNLEDIVDKYSKFIESKYINDILKKNNDDYILIDMRNTINFSASHLKNSINIPIDFNFFNILNNYISNNHKIIFLGNKNDFLDCILNCLMLGYYNIEGFYNMDNMDEINKEYIEKVDYIKVEEIDKSENNTFIDLRSKNEWRKGILKNSHTINYLDLCNNYNCFNNNLNKYVYCKLEPRSIIGYSFLKYKGVKNLKIVKGGYVSLLYQGLKLI